MTELSNLFFCNSCRHRPALLLLPLLVFSRVRLLHWCTKGRLTAQRKSLRFHSFQHNGEAAVVPTNICAERQRGVLCRKPGRQKHGIQSTIELIERIGDTSSFVTRNTSRGRAVSRLTDWFSVARPCENHRPKGIHKAEIYLGLNEGSINNKERCLRHIWTCLL